MENKCCCHEHEHEHDHNHEHEHDGCCHAEKPHGNRGEIIKLCVAAALLAAAIAVDRIFAIPTVFKILMFAVPYLVAGFDVLKEAAENILKGEIFDENFLMCVASIGAFCVGEYPEAAFVMIFFGVGELFEHIATEKSRRSIKSLLDIRPDKATVIRDGAEQTVLSEEVNIGETVRVLPGQRIPLDGVIISGTTATDNSAVTGESLPVNAGMGSEVYSGCVNLQSVIDIKTTKSFGESTASKILELVEKSSDKKSKSERFIRKFARVYTPIVCIAALLLATIPSIITGTPKTYIYRALMFLVVSCPCALVVSIPLTYFAGIASAAKCGILIKGSQYLETLTRVKAVLFDKTGTLTKGNFEVVAIHPNKVPEKELLRLAAAAESGSTHPISLSLKAAYGKMEKTDISDIREISGEGVTAVVRGKTVAVGNDKLMKRIGADYHDCHRDGTIVHVASEGVYLGHIVIGDALKPDAAEAVESLKKRNIATVMLTGDRESAAKAAAEKTGVTEYHSELKPEDKVRLLESHLNRGECSAFVGDGINDAPVLTRADVGIAMGALGSDAAIEAADVVLMEENVKAVDTAIKISKKTQKIVVENIAMSLFIKFSILILCAVGVGVTNMWIASFGDVGVLVLAVLNSTRAMR